ncbi:MAG TPA: hypothetical protein VHY09_01920 [Candidatus Methylacidiphilales bacterium]|jgi:hypothetical protein|nr:hypothetical protein [Candidatus Methylacidiphilales bacterium]
MKAASILSAFVVLSLLTGAVARGDSHVVHVSVMKNYCSGQGFCARMSNGAPSARTPAYTINPGPLRFNAVDGAPIN